MIEVDIPGFKRLCIEHLVLDFNGTLACDGKLVDGISWRMEELSKKLVIHVLTADTFGQVKSELCNITCKLTVLPAEDQVNAKLKYVQQLGPDKTVCIGNGRNDRLMIRDAVLGIAVILDEGAAMDTLKESDLVCTTTTLALDLLLKPLRLVATLRA